MKMSMNSVIYYFHSHSNDIMHSSLYFLKRFDHGTLPHLNKAIIELIFKKEILDCPNERYYYCWIIIVREGLMFVDFVYHTHGFSSPQTWCKNINCRKCVMNQASSPRNFVLTNQWILDVHEYRSPRIKMIRQFSPLEEHTCSKYQLNSWASTWLSRKRKEI